MHARVAPPQHQTYTADCITSATATQAANREMLCSLENINIPAWTHAHTHTQAIVLCFCVNVLVSVCLLAVSETKPTHSSQCRRDFQPRRTLFCTSFCESEVIDYT